MTSVYCEQHLLTLHRLSNTPHIVVFGVAVICFILFVGYMNLSDGSAGGDVPGVMSVSKEEVAMVTPRCLKTVYYLLDLYATMPETKTVAHRYVVLHYVF